MVFHVYVLKCSDRSFFVGHAHNLGKRLAEHHNKIFPNCYTASRLPVELVFQQTFASEQEALANQQTLSSWNSVKLQQFIDEQEQAPHTNTQPKLVVG